MPGGIVAPILGGLAVYLRDVFRLFASVDDKVNLVLFIRRVPGAHQTFGCRRLLRAFDNRLTTFAVTFSRAAGT